jgi:hypothetical protein
MAKRLEEDVKEKLVAFAERDPKSLAEALLEMFNDTCARKSDADVLRIACSLDLEAQGYHGPCLLQEVLGGAAEVGEVLRRSLGKAKEPEDRCSILGSLAEHYRKQGNAQLALDSLLDLARLVHSWSDGDLGRYGYTYRHVMKKGLAIARRAGVDASELSRLMEDIELRLKQSRQLESLIGRKPPLFSGVEEYSEVYGYGNDTEYIVNCLMQDPASRLGIDTPCWGSEPKLRLRKLAVGGLSPSDLSHDIDGCVVLFTSHFRRKPYTLLAVYKHGEFFYDSKQVFERWKVERVWAVLMRDGVPVKGWSQERAAHNVVAG